MLFSKKIYINAFITQMINKREVIDAYLSIYTIFVKTNF